MADSTILPGARAQLVLGSGTTTPEFYRFFQAVAKATGLTGDLDTQVKEIEKVIQTIIDQPDATIIPGEGIVVSGTLADGVVTLSLDSSGVIAGTYGDETHVPQITVDQHGRVTAAQIIEIRDSFVPYLVPAGTVFIVPAGKQALWAIPIELEDDAGLEIDGALVEVN